VLEEALLAFAETVGIGLPKPMPLKKATGKSKMIDRKALWIFIAVFLAITGASIWQLTCCRTGGIMPLGGPGSHNTVSGLVLFAAPASLLFFWVSPFIQWLTLPKETLPSLRRWSGKWIVSMSVFIGPVAGLRTDALPGRCLAVD